MENSKLQEIWENAWKQEIHTTDYALKRIKSAKSAKLTPIKIDTIDFYGYFQGSGGRYETFLNYCPCGDFRRSKLPCKHIYRLAIELGLMNIDVDYDTNAIPTPKGERLNLDSTIDIVENLSEEAQKKLLYIAKNIRSTSPTYPVVYKDNIIELLTSGIIIDSDPQRHDIKFGKKSDIIEFLDKENIPYDKKAKKSVLEEICLKYAPKKAAETFEKIIYITIPTKFSSKKIHYYLHRKYESELYYDENMDVQKVQLLDTNLPDDDVTNQLIKRGYYSRKDEQNLLFKVELNIR